MAGTNKQTNKASGVTDTWWSRGGHMVVTWLPVAALTGVFGESILSRWMDLGRLRLCFAAAADRGLMTLSMSSISFSCFLLRYSCLMNSFLALSSSFRRRSSSAFSLKRQWGRIRKRCMNVKIRLRYKLLLHDITT